MSLKVADWKSILDQPKNAGLKAFGGTGVSESLRKVDAAEQAFHAAQTNKAGQDLDTALTDVRTLCDGIVKKQKKVYTTACTHLEKVIASASARQKTLTAEMNTVRQKETEARVKQQETQQRSAAKKALDEACQEALKNVRAAKDMNELGTVIVEFAKKLTINGKDFPKLQAQINKVKTFNKQPDPRMGILEVRADYIKLVQETSTQVSAA